MQTGAMVYRWMSEDRADATAGLAAEVAYVAEVLVGTDSVDRRSG